MGRLSLILMSFLNEGRISAFDERVVEGVKLEHRFLFNGEIMKLLSLSLSLCFTRMHAGDIYVRYLIDFVIFFFYTAIDFILIL